jgi:hypothetical protein
MAAFRGVGKIFQTISLKFSTNCTCFFMDFALCLTLDTLASLVNAFFLVHDSENPEFGSSNLRGRARSDDHNILTNLNINEAMTISR